MNDLDIWITIVALGVGTFLLRFSFIGLVGDRELPEWLTQHLRYVPVAVLPGLIAPLIMWPAATDGMADPARLAAAAVTILIGAVFRSVIGAIIGGMGTLYLVQFLLA